MHLITLILQTRHRLLVGTLLTCYVLVQIYCIYRLTPTYDEGLFATYGATILKLEGNKDIEKFDSKLPITAFNMLPRAVEQVFHPGLHRAGDFDDIIHGRYVSLLASVLLALLIYRWAFLLYGSTVGIFSLLLFLLCPNFLAHGVFVSSDIFACLFMTAALYWLWRFTNQRNNSQFIACSLSVALAEISKFSMLHLFILVPLLLFIGCWRRPGSGVISRFLNFAKLMLVFCAINWLVVCTAHLFFDMFEPLGSFSFRSLTLQSLQQALHGRLSALPLPLPASYVKSLDIVLYLDRLGAGKPGSTIGSIYLLGQNRSGGFWYYYFVVLFFKLAIPTILLILFSGFCYARKFQKALFFQNEIFLLLPAVYFLVYMDFFYSTQIGVRHIMIILPLLYVFAGSLLGLAIRPFPRWLLAAAFLWQLISVASYFPHFLPYTNELLTNKKLVYRKLADTNLCYGEGGYYLQDYLAKHPEASYLPGNVRSGLVVMEVNEMLNIDIATVGCYDWVRGLEPTDHIQSQYLIFNISRDRADSILRQRSPQR